ncbi:DUF2878 domain-containing protein [Vibrio rhizosphaerae]|uniref:DUF2878 domain-containing protein n=1 Tax=Vibrio rhizosphaerae TaxID=398736 RepID=A0ABU4ISL7_9VIBR|nr:DUF2878 domain-containing protein [Vibrio rhizosphaerae]MDW6092407.1 DUF2878 domain-containing protein [Vibrio rhizosphaerae]
MMHRFLLISLWFEAIWLIAVLGQARLQWVTIGLVTVTMAYTAFRYPLGLGRIIGVAALGMTLDYINLQVGLLTFPTPELPIWLIGLWFAFAWFASFAIPFFSHLPFLLICCGTAFGGALSYWAGYRFGAVHFEWSVPGTVCVLFVEWFGLSLLLMKVWRHAHATFQRDTLSERNSLDRDR